MGQEIQILPPGEDWQPPHEHVNDLGAGPEPELGEDEQVRYWSTDRLRVLIRHLQPYVDGSFGTVSTKHAQVYLSAVRELNKLWHAYYAPPPPAPPEPSEEEQDLARTEAAQITRQKVLDQLSELRARTR